MPHCVNRPRLPGPYPATLALLLACAACGDGPDPPHAAGQPMAVQVVTLAASAAPHVVELPGRIEAARSAEVRARVDGIVEHRAYQEGTDVAAGALLFEIDARDYRAQLQQAQAALRRAESVRANAASVVSRFKPLVGNHAISAQEYDAALATMHQAEANVSDASAAVAQARLRLDRCAVRAPIAGRVGRAQVSEGALVSASAATLMAQVKQLSPIHAVFTQSNTAILDFLQQVQAGAMTVPDMKRIEVRLILANGQEYGEPGFLDFTDLAVDPSTGAQTIRAQFANPDRTLLPGQFVRGRIAAGTNPRVYRVPERAVKLDNDAASVALVGPDGTVVRRNVALGTQSQGEWLVLHGLKAGEQLIVDGWHKVQPGQRVTAQAAPGATVSSPSPSSLPSSPTR